MSDQPDENKQDQTAEEASPDETRKSLSGMSDLSAGDDSASQSSESGDGAALEDGEGKK